MPPIPLVVCTRVPCAVRYLKEEGRLEAICRELPSSQKQCKNKKRTTTNIKGRLSLLVYTCFPCSMQLIKEGGGRVRKPILESFRHIKIRKGKRKVKMKNGLQVAVVMLKCIHYLVGEKTEN
ncbi:hypothetical protein NDU88_002493 [Pleurodeles waltl]|uniref:60S ribosomal protein L34 n=1 Tax=Pleurodeles waltl TaxID=8319 RepID=A0AAV7RFQ8_PLEWA|nr:hypothetical protein NDU88_002493 [Pleurodeles waltl]